MPNNSPSSDAKTSENNSHTDTAPSAGKQHSIGLRGQLTQFLIRAIGKLPLSFARSLGSFMGSAVWLLKDRSASVTLDNLKLCFPEMSEEKRRRLAKQSLKETGKLAAEICVIHNRSHAWLEQKIVSISGEDIIKNHIAKGKGLILLAPHVGNWEVLSQCLPSYGKLTALYQPPKQAYLEDMVKSARQKTGAELVPTNRKGIVRLLASLKNGGITAVLPDQNPVEGSGDFSPFYGHQAYTMTLVYGFLRRTECPVVLGLVRRVKAGFEVIYMDAPEDIYSDDQAKSLAALNTGVEMCVAHCPEQYQWEYKRFKKQPDGKASPYRR